MPRHPDSRGRRRGGERRRGWVPVLGMVAGLTLAQSIVLFRPAVAAAAGTHPITLQVRIHDAGHQVVSTVAAGAPVHLRVTVFADIKGDPVPTGQVDVIYYTDGVCTTPGGSRSGTLVNGTAEPAGTPVIPARAGTMSFRASYAGDATFVSGASACLPLTITKATPSLALRLTRDDVDVSTMPAGQHVVFRLAVTGPAGVVTATGSAKIQFHSGTTCSSPALSNIGPVSDGVFEHHRPIYVAGEYSVNATYDGDANWLPGAFTGCLRLTVTHAPSTLTTAIHDSAHAAVTSVDVGAAIHANVAISTGLRRAPTGTLRAQAYSDPTCGTPFGTPVLTPVVVDGYDGIAEFPAISVTATPGARAIRVEYLGDATFLPVLGACTPFSVNGGAPTAPTPTVAIPTNAPPTNAAPTNAVPGSSASPGPTAGASTPGGGPGSTILPGTSVVTDPGLSAAPGASADPAGSAEPLASGVTGGGASPGASVDPAAVAPSNPGNPAALPAASGGPFDAGMVALLLLAILVGGLAFAGATVARRKAAAAAPRA